MPESVDHSDFMTRFTPGLLNPDEPTPGTVTGHSGKAANKRFDVYRNNVTASLVNAVGQVYPLTRKALGEDTFRHAALTYVRTSPPTSRLLFEYGQAFGLHLKNGGYMGGRPWLGDLARLERAWLDAYHAADAGPLTAEAMATLPPDRLGDAVFNAHPAARLVSSAYPVVTIWSRLKSGEFDAASPVHERAETALVTRPALTVDVRALSPALATFFGQLMGGAPIGEAATTAAENPSGGFDITMAIAAILETGAFVTVSVPG